MADATHNLRADPVSPPDSAESGRPGDGKLEAGHAAIPRPPRHPRDSHAAGRFFCAANVIPHRAGWAGCTLAGISVAPTARLPHPYDVGCGAGHLSSAGEGQGEACDLSGRPWSLTPALSRSGEGARRGLHESMSDDGIEAGRGESDRRHGRVGTCLTPAAGPIRRARRPPLRPAVRGRCAWRKLCGADKCAQASGEVASRSVD